MIRRCYYLVGKSMFTITPLVLLLVASTVATLWVTVSVITFVTSIETKGLVPSPRRADTSWLFLMSVLLPSVLDLTLTILLLYYLTRTMKRVYTAHTRKRISHLVNIVWQSALPPTLGAICLTGFYIQYTTATVPQVSSDLLFWYPILHGMVGKLYVLSLLYMVNAQPLQLEEQPTTFISTFTVPAEVMYTHAREARGGGTACSENVAGSGPVRTVNFAV
ncbi:hypothetical protein EDB87DRAFT_1649793 [Lactarius vividus]|nr:hypothetical protein EDB87DRAFT_1649793 [Lactarius vividus]